MNRSSPSQKPKNFTSIIKHQKPSCPDDLSINSTIKPPQKFDQEQNLQDSKQLVRFLLCKLEVLQQKQKQNENKFLECLKSLRNQIASKDKINHNLTEQILLLRQEVTQLKGKLNKCSKPRTNQISKLSNMQNSSSLVNPQSLVSSQSPDKQNIHPYLMQKLSSQKHSKRLSQALSKVHEQKLDKISKPSFKIEDFMRGSKITQFDQYYHNSMSRQNAWSEEGLILQKKRYVLGGSRSGKKSKSKSIGILKTKLFAK